MLTFAGSLDIVIFVAPIVVNAPILLLRQSAPIRASRHVHPGPLLKYTQARLDLSVAVHSTNRVGGDDNSTIIMPTRQFSLRPAIVLHNRR